MFEAAVLYFLSPVSLVLWMGFAAGVLAMLRRRRAAAVVAGSAFALLWISSTPWVADALIDHLEGQTVALAPKDAPQADAILVLGGAVAGTKPPERPTIGLGPSSTRVLYAAALYRAGKAPWIVVAAGNRPEYAQEEVEADAIAEFLLQLGVPRSAILLEGSSQTTRQNAANVLPVLQKLGAKRVLLVTSGVHMPRAMKTFVKTWAGRGPQLIPAVTDTGRRTGERAGPNLWLPSLEALISVTRAIKELAGTAALTIIP